MSDDFDRLDRELGALGEAWRAEHTGHDFVPADLTGTPAARGPWLLLGAAAAVVVAVVLGTILLSPAGRNSPGPADGSPDVTNRLDCSVPGSDPVQGAPVVPVGAVAARLCGSSEGDDGFRQAWPVDTLTGPGVTALVTSLNELRPYREVDGVCQLPPRTFELVLRYPDGSRVVLTRDSPRCGALEVRGGGTWGDSQVSDLVTRLITQQRRANPSTSAPVPTQCPVKWQNLASTVNPQPVTPSTDVAVTACQYRLTGRDRIIASPRLTGTLDLQAVVHDPATILATALRGTATDSCGPGLHALPSVQRVLLVRDRYGDIHVVPTEPCWPSTLTGSNTYPDPALGTAVAALFPQNQ